MTPADARVAGEGAGEPDPLAASVLLVGCGKMGGALLEGWLARTLRASEIDVVEPSSDVRERLEAHGLRRLVGSVAALEPTRAPDILVLAVKPQTMKEVVAECVPLAGDDTLILSIAAGCPIKLFEDAFGRAQPIVRVMPNTPAAIGHGISVLCANDRVDERKRQAAMTLMKAVGDVLWVDDEDELHAVTAVSGSGPAYVFALVEALSAAGIAEGLPHELAENLARKTVAGAGALLDRAEESASDLRRNVTSPGGTTEAALAILMNDDRLAHVVSQAVAAAAARSRELAQS